MTQRDLMRKLLIEHGYAEQAVCAAYAKAEQQGLVQRLRNKGGYTPEGYAKGPSGIKRSCGNLQREEMTRSSGQA